MQWLCIKGFMIWFYQGKWTNKQRVLVMSSRGLKTRERHIMEDIRNLLPHCKSEPKFDMKKELKALNEVQFAY